MYLQPLTPAFLLGILLPYVGVNSKKQKFSSTSQLWLKFVVLM